MRSTSNYKRKKRYRLNTRGRVLVILLLSIAVMLVFSIAPGLKYNRAYEKSLMTPVGDINAVPPEISAGTAIMYSLDLNKPVYEKDADKRVSPYSITKILTCYLALENLDPDQEVRVSAKAAEPLEDGTTMLLKEGEVISVRDLLYGAMMVSGNDAAYALGEAVAGSNKKFTKMMNEKAAEWGCTDTHFVNPHGWKNENHYTTARDFCIIVTKCFENEELRKISMTKEYEVPATNKSGARTLDNHTLAATWKAGDAVTCGKTGGWTSKDTTLAFEFDNGQLSGAVALFEDSVKGRRNDAKKLVKFAPVVTPGYTVSTENDEVFLAKVKHGAVTRVALTPDASTVAYPASGEKKDIKIKVETDKLVAPLHKGDPAGTYAVYANDKLVTEHKLLVAEDVKTGWLPSYLYISNLETICIIMVILIVLLLSYAADSGRKKRKRQAAAKNNTKTREE